MAGIISAYMEEVEAVLIQLLRDVLSSTV